MQSKIVYIECRGLFTEGSPYLFQSIEHKMIESEVIEKIIADKIAADGVFIVELNVSNDNSIRLVVDRKTGVDIDYCIELSHLIEAGLDRDKEDFEIEVSSAGIGCELKVLGQYEKNLGNEIEITFANGSHKNGVLTAADADGFEADIDERVEVEGQKKKQMVRNHYRFAYSEVKKVKDIISFK